MLKMGNRNVSKEQLKQKMSRYKQEKKIYIETKHRNET